MENILFSGNFIHIFFIYFFNPQTAPIPLAHAFQWAGILRGSNVIGNLFTDHLESIKVNLQLIFSLFDTHTPSPMFCDKRDRNFSSQTGVSLNDKKIEFLIFLAIISSTIEVLRYRKLKRHGTNSWVRKQPEQLNRVVSEIISMFLIIKRDQNSEDCQLNRYSTNELWICPDSNRISLAFSPRRERRDTMKIFIISIISSFIPCADNEIQFRWL